MYAFQNPFRHLCKSKHLGHKLIKQKSNKEVDIYLIPGKTSGCNTEITHRENIVAVQVNKRRKTRPDESLTSI